MSGGERFEWGAELPGLEGSRVKLRSLGDHDVPALLAIFGDPEVMRFWSSPPVAGEAGARALLDDIRRHFQARTLFQWGIARADDNEIVGTVTIFHMKYEGLLRERYFLNGEPQDAAWYGLLRPEWIGAR